MRRCRAAVIHVAVDDVIIDKDGKEHPQINGNVLIEIGAAMGLYPGYKFILLVEEGLKLPSNLQGLYECRYSGNELTAGATMKLLKAFNEFKAGLMRELLQKLMPSRSPALPEHELQRAILNRWPKRARGRTGGMANRNQPAAEIINHLTAMENLQYQERKELKPDPLATTSGAHSTPWSRPG